MSQPHSTHPHHEPTGLTEPDTIDVRSIVGYGIGLTVVAVISHVAMLLMFNGLERSVDAANPPRVYPLAVDTDDRRPPEPRLQGGVESAAGKLLESPPDHNPGPREALKELRDLEEAMLSGYGWVDRNANLVRIPIAEAMKLTLQRGLPARPAGAAQASPAQEPSKEQSK
jgi:hypothetical protein